MAPRDIYGHKIKGPNGGETCIRMYFKIWALKHWWYGEDTTSGRDRSKGATSKWEYNIKMDHWVLCSLCRGAGGVKSLGCEADNSHPSTAQFKNDWSYTSTPQHVSWRAQGHPLALREVTSVGIGVNWLRIGTSAGCLWRWCDISLLADRQPSCLQWLSYIQ